MMKRRDFLQKSAWGVLSAGTIANQGVKAETVPSLSGGKKKRPNVLWIMLDDGRADTVGCYNAPWAKTPNLDRLASQGVRFHDAIIQNPVCVPSRRSMKSGFYAHEVGPVAMGKEPDQAGDYIDQEQMEKFDQSPTLLDVWNQVGMKPINVGKIHGFHRCFDHRGDAPRFLNVHGKPTPYFEKTFGDRDDVFKTKPVVTDTHQWMIGGLLDVEAEQTEPWRLGNRAVETIKELTKEDDPFFLRVSFHEPHVPCYVPPEYFIDPGTIDLPFPKEEELASKPEFEKGPLHTYAGASLSREEIDLCRGTYYGMVSLVDVQIGRIVKALEEAGELENTVIAFTSDQGFQLGEHNLWKKRVFYEANVRVPLIFRYPQKLPQGKVIEEPVELIDFLPTLLELTDLEVPKAIRGRSLMPLIQGEVNPWRKACFSEIDHSQSMYQELRQGTGRRVMVRTKEWKLIYFMDHRVEDKDGALYDLKNDPGETMNLYHDPKHRDVIEELETMAKHWDAGDDAYFFD